MRQKSNISEHMRPIGRCATCKGGKGSSYTKNEYNLLYHKLDAEYFFIQQFFRKKQRFLGKLKKKLFWEHIWPFFREMGRPTQKVNITFSITN